MSDDEFLAAFEACTLPREQFTHAAHVRMAWLYAGRRADATDVARAGIRRYNASLGNTTGYHDTLTVAFARLVARAVPGESFAAFRGRHPELFDDAKGVIARHYSPERLESPAARDGFVEPDREKLP